MIEGLIPEIDGPDSVGRDEEVFGIDSQCFNVLFGFRLKPVFVSPLKTRLVRLVEIKPRRERRGYAKAESTVAQSAFSELQPMLRLPAVRRDTVLKIKCKPVGLDQKGGYS